MAPKYEGVGFYCNPILLEEQKSAKDQQAKLLEGTASLDTWCIVLNVYL